MPELRLQREGDALTATLGEHHSTIPWSEIVQDERTWRHIYDDAIGYGRELFDLVTQDAALRAALTDLRANDRLLLVADQPEVAAIPWEYLRTEDDRLLAARLNFVRSIPPAERREPVAPAGPLEIIAIPVSPVDDPRVLNTEREWLRLVDAVAVTEKALTLTRVRPPMLTSMERALTGQGTSIIHFMGHGGRSRGQSVLVFEDDYGRARSIDSATFTESLDESVFLVVLNSCLTAVATATEFGNIAQAIVRQGIPYALGMQFSIPDDAALELSKTLYDFLLQRRSVEQAVRLTRRALEDNKKLSYTMKDGKKLSHAPWLAGIPALYTNQREPAPGIQLETGPTRIQPDPGKLQATCDLAALPQAEHFVGRGQEMGEVLQTLLQPAAKGFVVLHGLGGIGKIALARAISERVGWHYNDRILAYSFETFASFDSQNNVTVSETFTDRFCNRLARFYQIDPSKHTTTLDLQQAILQGRKHYRALLVLDNMETLISAQTRYGSEPAKNLATFLSRMMREGSDPILLTSRDMPPADWGERRQIILSGLSDDAGADLFLALLPADRKRLAPSKPRQALTQRVQGHPLSIRLLAGRFADDTATDLTTIEQELARAEGKTPSSLEDAQRHATLYACMDYSIRRLSPEQKKVLHMVSIFQAPFPPAYAQYLLEEEATTEDEEQQAAEEQAHEEETAKYLQDLTRLGLLETTTKDFDDGELTLLELHPMLRWYIEYSMPALDASIQERYGLIYEQLARQAYGNEGGYDQSALTRYLIRQSLSDCEAALHYLSPQEFPGLSSNKTV